MSLEVQALRDPRALLVGWDGMGLAAWRCVLHQRMVCHPEATPDCHSHTERCAGAQMTQHKLL